MEGRVEKRPVHPSRREPCFLIAKKKKKKLTGQFRGYWHMPREEEKKEIRIRSNA